MSFFFGLFILTHWALGFCGTGANRGLVPSCEQARLFGWGAATKSWREDWSKVK